MDLRDPSDITAPWGVIAPRAMVASGHPLATQAARTVLQEGGSAVDAAIAADAVMGVVEPMATGIGGDLMAMLVQPDGTVHSYNGSGRAPRALQVDAVRALPQGRIPERHVLSVTTPGAVRGWFDLHARHGRLPMARLLMPAIGAAREGYRLGTVAAREWAWFDSVLHADPCAAELYRAGRPPQSGERLTNTALAAVLAAIAQDGAGAFYEGAPAQEAARACQAHGGPLRAEDFAHHTGEFTVPLATRFRGLTIYQCPPNTHGLAVLEALQALEPLALAADDPTAMVAAVQAMASGLGNAKATVADPAGNTVCTVVVDETGLAVTLMSSLFKRFGSGIGVPGCGFVLQNRGFGFAAPGQLNGAAPGRRPFHTVIPAAATREGRFHAAWGVVGGAMQPQGQLQLLLRLAAHGMPLQQALDAPRWRLESPTELAIEPGLPRALVAALRNAGYVEPKGAGELGGRSDFGGAQFVLRRPDGTLAGASDRRKDGQALGL